MHSALTENKIMNTDEKMMVFDLIEKLIEKGETISISAFGFRKREKSGYAVVRLNTGQTAYADSLADALKQLCVAVDIQITETSNRLADAVRKLETRNADMSPEYYQGLEDLAQELTVEKLSCSNCGNS